MTPFDLLTKEELSLMDIYRRIYVPRGDRGEEFSNYCSMPYLLREWNAQKQPLLKLFGNKLILEKEIHYEESQETLYNEMRDMLGGKRYGRLQHSASAFLYAYREKILQVVSRTSEEYLRLLSFITPSVLVDNIYNGINFTVDNLDIKNGTKIIKILAKLASKWHLEGFEDFRICHSVVLNGATLKGTLCLSIHPFDYWTMSDNSNDWDTCMSWGPTERNDYGCYRQGTVECMNSPATIVAYLKDSNNFDFAFNSYWNSKKWRQLVTFDCNAIYAIKGYPFQNDGLSTLVIDWLRELASKNLGEEYLPVEKTGDIVNLGEHAFEFQLEVGKMYCDQNALPYHWVSVNSNPKYSNSYTYGNNYHVFYIEESGSGECMVCGELTDEFSDEEQLACNDCCFRRCALCGDTIYAEDQQLVLSDERIICRNCFSREDGFECSQCGELALLDDDVIVYEAISGEEEGTVRLGEIVADCCCTRCAKDWGTWNTTQRKHTRTFNTYHGTYWYVFADELDDSYPKRGTVEDYDDPIYGEG